MKTLPLVAFSVALTAALLPAPQAVRAGTGIQRCQAADGTVVYTDRACATHGARAVPMSGELMTRLASERSREPDASEILGTSTTALTASVGRRSPMDGCAKSPTQLAMDLQGSVALKDVNRLAESYHWVGQSHEQARPLLARLDRMAQRPLQDIAFFDARIGPGGMQLSDAGGSVDGSAGILQLTLGSAAAPEIVDFRVERYSGCYFVRF